LPVKRNHTLVALTITDKRGLPNLLILFFSLLSSSLLRAQLCNGSLGDPVVSITFGAGGNMGNYTPPGAYTYVNSVCPNDGYYTITDKTSGCFGNSWHTVTSDHTGKGAFLLVNASYTPGDFFLTTVSDLCPDTDYEFAAWIMNVLSRFGGIRPSITFTIEAPDGTILKEFTTGDIPELRTPEWKQYGFYFTTPPTNPVIVLRMRNNAPGGNGNDLALDDITFRPCGPTITSHIQNMNSDTVNVCEGNTDLYSFVADASLAYQDPAFQWQVSLDTGKTWNDIAGATTINYLRPVTLTPGIYLYRTAVTERSSANIISCRIASNVIMINIHPIPVVTAGADRAIISGDTLHLAGFVSGEDPSFSWDPPLYLDDPGKIAPISLPTTGITYKLSATSAYGCVNEDSMTVKVVAGIFVPSAFTPNHDGKNDRWRIPYLDPAFGATVNVFNRWGQLVYHVEGQSVDWDGTVKGQPQASGSFVYYIRFKNGRKQMKGIVTLIR
jgi:gliding motility-associated-like protein